jgi:hypothetical protein
VLDESDEEGRMADDGRNDKGEGVIIQLFGGRYGYIVLYRYVSE